MTKDSISKSYKPEPRLVETFVIIDLDRTLLNTDAWVNLVYLQLQKRGITPEQARHELDFTMQQTGTSFSLLEHIERTRGKVLLNDVMNDILLIAQNGELDPDELLYAGTAQLLNVLEARNVPFAILTYGNELDQTFKLDIVRALLGRNSDQLHGVVTDEPKKAAWIVRSWTDVTTQRGVGIPISIAKIEGLRASCIVILDDKKQNLEPSADFIKGILVDNSQQDSGGALSIITIVHHLESGSSLQEIAGIQG